MKLAPLKTNGNHGKTIQLEWVQQIVKDGFQEQSQRR